MTTKLSDLQLILLSAAAARADGSLLPPPESVAGQLARIRKTIPPLLKRTLVAEVTVTEPTQIWREQDGRQIGIIITDAGRATIGAESPEQPIAPPAPPTPMRPEQVTAPAIAAGSPAKPSTKAATMLELLHREQGATLAELGEVTGWLPHTTRAALTGLRKKGHSIAKGKRGETTCYRIDEAA